MSFTLFHAATAWPATLPARVTLNPRPISRTGGVSLGGGELVTQSGAGYWNGTLRATIQGPARMTTWRAIQARLRGRGGMVLVPAWWEQVPAWATAAEMAAGSVALAGRTPPGPITFSNALPFAAGAGWGGSRWSVRVVADCAAQAQGARLAVLAGDVPLPGALVSRHGRLHRLDTVTPAGVSDQFDVTFWPPLREAWPAGSMLEADRPTCLMRLDSDEEGATSPRDMSVTLNLREAF